jgi:hypothetical protein
MKKGWLGKHEGKAPVKKHEEKKLITAYERGEIRPARDQTGPKHTAVEAALRSTREDTKI